MHCTPAEFAFFSDNGKLQLLKAFGYLCISRCEPGVSIQLYQFADFMVMVTLITTATGVVVSIHPVTFTHYEFLTM